MKIETHIKNSLQSCRVGGRDIHEWIDAHFNHENFKEYLRTGILPKDWDPYEHRIYRHCLEALEECIDEFKEKYTAEQIEGVFKSHLLDDYRGYLPRRKDFMKLDFHDKYHKF